MTAQNIGNASIWKFAHTFTVQSTQKKEG